MKEEHDIGQEYQQTGGPQAVPRGDKPSGPSTGALIAGAILILIGIVSLLMNFNIVNDSAFIAAIGIAFLIAFAVRRNLGFLIPGMILLFLGIGVTLDETDIFTPTAEGFIIVFSLGVAFLAIYAFMGRFRHWWPLIPGGILLLVGGTGLLAEARVVPFTIDQIFSYGWPAALIIVGLWLVIRQYIKR